ncbi:MAG: malonyl-CoA O-methyltransferase [Gammaproteobacteria bacterium]|nr:MAG: malonyl-CoA O-methyltransferase [Gammaproteobacteria bacterium]TND03677.1 MAG: malonyl-CoA O-methyltransferase [Gammaproteobacteria bacterium]
MTDTTTTNAFYLDKQQVRAAFDRAAATYDEIAVLQREVGERMLERLELVKIEPSYIADIGAGTGRCSAALAKRYRHSQVIALDIAPGMLAEARRRDTLMTRWFGHKHYLCGDAEALPLADHSVDLVFSNLTVQWCNDLDQTLREFQRVLKPGGLLMFTTLGPDTLKELRHSWMHSDGYNHVNAFYDMHDIGDALVRARMTTPVMDVEHFTLTYPDVMHLMRDLKAIGGHNVTAGRAHGLTGPRRLKAMTAAYEQFRRDGLLPATYEVVYGHTWAPEISANRPAPGGDVQIPVTQIGRRQQKQF